MRCPVFGSSSSPMAGTCPSVDQACRVRRTSWNLPGNAMNGHLRSKLQPPQGTIGDGPVAGDFRRIAEQESATASTRIPIPWPHSETASMSARHEPTWRSSRFATRLPSGNGRPTVLRTSTISICARRSGGMTSDAPPGNGCSCRPVWSDVPGRRSPREIGYRAMAVFRGRTDPAAALYVSTWSPARAERGAILLRSRDGLAFEALPPPRGDPELNSYRILLPAGGRLFTSPTGRVEGRPNAAASGVILMTDDPATRPWVPANQPGFGDPANTTVFEMAELDGWVYAGTLNVTRGFQVWKAPLQSDGLGPWRRILTDGAGRGPLNRPLPACASFRTRSTLGRASKAVVTIAPTMSDRPPPS